MGALTEAYVVVLPDMKRFPRELKSGLRRVDTASAGRDAGRKFGGAFGGTVKGMLAAGAIFAGLSKATGFLKEANAEARESAKVGKVTAQVIKSTGGAAKITSNQVGALATSISNATGKDDELVQSGANLLLTFKNVRNEVGKGSNIFDRATRAAVDLSATGFGSVAGSSKMLGKALNDPVAGITALQRAGVTFSAQQKKQIKVMVESGNVLGAQKLIMAEVESQVGGVAAASADASEKYAVSAGNFKELVGGAIKPALDTFYNAMSKRVFPALSETVTWLSKRVPAAVTEFRNAFRTGMTEDEGTMLERVALAARSVSQFIKGQAIPAVTAFYNTLRTGMTEDEGTPIERLALTIRNNVLPVLSQVGSFIRGTVLPGLKALGAYVLSTLLPAWLSWYGFLIKQMTPILKQIGGFVRDQVIPALGAVARFIASDVVPGFLSIVETVKGLIRVVAPIIGEIVGVIIGQFTKMRPQIQSIWGSVKEIITGVMFIVKDVIQAVTTIIRLVWDRWGDDIKKIVSVVFGTIFKVVAGVMKAIAGVIKLIVALIKGDWKGAWTAIKQIFSGIWQAIKAILTVTMGQIVKFFTTRLADIKTRWTDFWFNVRKSAKDSMAKVRTGIADALARVRDGFKSGVEAIGRQWDKIKATAKKPIEFIINTVLDAGILGAFRAISKLVGFSEGEKFHVGLPKGWASGGVLPGYTPGRDVHRFYSPTGGAIDLSGGEGIARPEIVRAIGRKRWDAANKEAAHGKISRAVGYLGGYWMGGQMPVPGGVSNKHSGYPWATWAGDLHAGMGTPVRAWNSGRVAAVHNWGHSYGHHVRVNHPGNQQTLYAHMRDIIVRIGQAIGRGGLLGHSDSTGNSSGPHLHFELKNGQGSLGGTGGGPAGIGIAAPLVDAAKYISQIGGAIGRLKEIGGTPFGQMVAGIPKMVVGAVKDKISSLVGAFNGSNSLAAGATGPGVNSTWSGGGFGRWSASQMSIASTIANTGKSMGAKAQLIGIITGIVESGLRNVNFGDRDSLGVFQQRAPWGPASVRRNVRASAGMFFHGGRGGQRGLDDIRGWQGMSPGRAAQSVQVSAFPGRYGAQVGLGNSILGALARNSSSPLMTGGIIRGGRGGVLAQIGEGRRDELVAPLPRNWRSAAAPRSVASARPITINIDLGDGLSHRVQGILDENDEFHASVGRMRR